MLDPLALIDAVEAAFGVRGDGDIAPGGVLGVEMAGGGFHIKAAALRTDRGIFAAKLNGNFPGNPASNGLPTIQGLVLAVDVATGAPRAVMDSSSLTRLRTAAASAVAVRHLAGADADHVTLIGCGVQGFDQLRFAHLVRPTRSITLFDPRVDAARSLATRIEQELGIHSHVADDLPSAATAGAGAIIITCTTSRAPLLEPSMVAAGTLVVAAGADNPHKVELAPALLAASKVVTDDTAQCAMIGDLHHAIASGAMRREDVHAELGEVVAGKRPGRTSRDERIIFDSTGLPLQDAAAAELVLALIAGMDDIQHFAFRP